MQIIFSQKEKKTDKKNEKKEAYKKRSPKVRVEISLLLIFSRNMIIFLSPS